MKYIDSIIARMLAVYGRNFPFHTEVLYRYPIIEFVPEPFEIDIGIYVR